MNEPQPIYLVICANGHWCREADFSGRTHGNLPDAPYETRDDMSKQLDESVSVKEAIDIAGINTLCGIFISLVILFLMMLYIDWGNRTKLLELTERVHQLEVQR